MDNKGVGARVTEDRLWYVYVLRNVHGQHVYTGCTNRPQHRLDAHRGRRAGGARTTRRWGPDAAAMIYLVGPFPHMGRATSKSAAHSFERKMKRERVGYGGVKGRSLVLHRLLSLPGGRVSDKVHLGDDTYRLHVQSVYSEGTFLAHATTRWKKGTRQVQSAKLPTDTAYFTFDCPQLPPPAPLI